MEFIPEKIEDVGKGGQILAYINAMQKKESHLKNMIKINIQFLMWKKCSVLFILQEVDFSTFPIVPFWSRLLVDLTTVAFQENFILLSRYPEEESRLTAVIRPFSFTVKPRKQITK